MSYIKDNNKCNIIEKICENESNCPQMIFSVTPTTQTVVGEEPVIFVNNSLLLGNSIIHTVGSPEFNIICPGKYLVTFTGSVGSPFIDTGLDVSVAIALNGTIVPGTTVSEYVTLVTNNAASLSTQAIIEISPFLNNIITIVNPREITQTFTNANIIIQRIDD